MLEARLFLAAIVLLLGVLVVATFADALTGDPEGPCAPGGSPLAQEVCTP